MQTEKAAPLDGRLTPFLDDIATQVVNGYGPDQIVHFLSLLNVVVSERDVEQFIEENALAIRLVHFLSLHKVVVTMRDAEQFIEENALTVRPMRTAPETGGMMQTEKAVPLDGRLTPFFDYIIKLAVNGYDADKIVHFLSKRKVVVSEQDVEQFIEGIALAVRLMRTTPEQFMKTIFPRGESGRS